MSEAAEELQELKGSDSIYGVNRYDEGAVEKRVAKFEGLERVVYEFLDSRGQMDFGFLSQVFQEMDYDGKDFVTSMMNHGAIKQDKVVELSLKVDPGELAGKELIEPSIPAALLKRHKIMLSAITDTHVYLSTLGNKTLSKRALMAYFPHHQFYFTPAKVSRILAYLKKVERYGNQQGTLLEILVRKAIREKVSDIHVYPTREGYNVKFRYLGQLYVERVGGLEEYLQLVTKAKIESGLDPSDRRRPQDGQFSIDYNGRRVDNRVSTLPTIGNKESLVIRILDPENSQVHFNDLGITCAEDIKKALRSPNGIVLVCGVTGSGKTTTIASAIRFVLNRFKQSINTIEDPVENELSDVKQTQVDPRSELTFAKVLRSILRQDPDVVVVGEVRDEETANIMFQAAETGHLLMGTLHVKDVRGVITRLENLKVERDKILNQLRGILVQKLIRVVCHDCGGKGCVNCNDKGYTGRTVVSEAVYLHTREDVMKLLDYNIPKWWDSTLEDAYKKYRSGMTDRKEMVSAFGSDFETYEDEQANKAVSSVTSGKMDLDKFLSDFPAHRHLIEDRAL